MAEEKKKTTKDGSFGLDIEEMAEVGLHFGHKRSKVHPRMEPYLYGIRNTIYLINLEETKKKLEEALKYIQEIIQENKTLLLVGTRIQSQDLVKEIAQECGLPFVSERWIGGTFTNFEVIRKRIEYFKDLKEKRDKGELEKYTKKEQSEIKDEIKKLDRKFGGIEDMDKLPEAVFITSIKENELIVKEARDKGVKVIGIIDANANPLLADFPIPGNDDAKSGVKYIFHKVKDAILEATSRPKKTTEES